MTTNTKYRSYCRVCAAIGQAYEETRLCTKAAPAASVGPVAEILAQQAQAPSAAPDPKTARIVVAS